MIEINRKLYVKEDYSVDRASLRKVVIALDSVREKFAENHFFAFLKTPRRNQSKTNCIPSIELAVLI